MAAINPLRAHLEQDRVAMGLGVRLVRHADIIALAASCGFDWIFLDLEHGPMSIDTAAGLSVAAVGAGLAPLARVAPGDLSTAGRMLDGGAWGVLMSHVETPAEATAFVRALSFPPEGTRSVSYSLPQLGFESMQGGAAAHHFNGQMLRVAMIESARGVAHAAEIAAVPGVDALFVGANDLSMDLGVHGEYAHPAVATALDQVVDGCRVHGKWPGMGGIYAEAEIVRHVARGMRLVLGATDLALMTDALRVRAAMLTRALGESGSAGPEDPPPARQAIANARRKPHSSA